MKLSRYLPCIKDTFYTDSFRSTKILASPPPKINYFVAKRSEKLKDFRHNNRYFAHAIKLSKTFHAKSYSR